MAISLKKRTSLAILMAVALMAAVLYAGTATANASPLRLDGSKTSVTVVPSTLQVLLGASIIPLPVAPSPVMGTADSLKFAFPVTGGTVDSKTLAGKIRHSGGILFVKWNGMGWSTLKLTNYVINIGNESFITAKVNGGPRLRVLELDLSGATIKQFNRNGRTFVSVMDVKVGLNDTAIGAINTTFGTALPKGSVIPFGTADVLARVARMAH
jgi:hypothetical protein